MIDDWGISCEIALTRKPQDLTDDKSTLVQVMAWCRQATSHYLSQCWPSSLSPYGVTRPQWVNCRLYVLWSLCFVLIYKSYMFDLCGVLHQPYIMPINIMVIITSEGHRCVCVITMYVCKYTYYWAAFQTPCLLWGGSGMIIGHIMYVMGLIGPSYWKSGQCMVLADMWEKLQVVYMPEKKNGAMFI